MFDRFRQFLRESRGELKRVNWPSQEQMKNFTVVVLVALLVLGAFIWLVDAVLSFAFEWTIFRGGGGTSATAGLRLIVSELARGLQSALIFMGNLAR